MAKIEIPDKTLEIILTLAMRQLWVSSYKLDRKLEVQRSINKLLAELQNK